MTHMHIPTLPPFEPIERRVIERTGPKHRASILPADVLALDMLAMRINHRPNPRRAMRKHIETDALVDSTPTQARCTGGLTNRHGVRLTSCRSSVCPRHTPEGYAECMARHTPESF